MGEDIGVQGGLRVLVEGSGERRPTGKPHLTCSTVGYTGAPITAQVEIGRAGTFVTSARGQQAQVAAATIVDLAGVIGHCQKKKKTG